MRGRVARDALGWTSAAERVETPCLVSTPSNNEARGVFGESTPHPWRVGAEFLASRRSGEFGEDLVGDVEVAEDVLDVVGVLERLDEPEDPPRTVLVHLDGHA